MTAIPSDTFRFQIGNVSFHVEREPLEMYPGFEGQIVTIEYSYEENRSGAGVCVRI